MITQRHGRKLASQLGEVLFLCQFYDLQIETKVSLSLRNFVVALSVCVCVCSFLHKGITWMSIILWIILMLGIFLLILIRGSTYRRFVEKLPFK